MTPGPGDRGGWRLETWDGPAGELHARSAEAAATPGRQVRVLRASRVAVVLGSAEPAAHVDAARAARLGVEVARRRSGGSAVLVGPGESLWVDLVVQRGDLLWDDDVGRAARWVGAAWAGALRAVGLSGAEVWDGPMLRTRWSERVCFAGVGPGEVVERGPGAAPRKLVGLAQRRTRSAALFQTAVPLRWRPSDLLAVLELGGGGREEAASELAGAAAAVEAPVRELLAALLCALEELPADPAAGAGTAGPVRRLP